MTPKNVFIFPINDVSIGSVVQLSNGLALGVFTTQTKNKKLTKLDPKFVEQLILQSCKLVHIETCLKTTQIIGKRFIPFIQPLRTSCP